MNGVAIDVTGDISVRDSDLQVSNGNLYKHNAQFFETVNGNGNIGVGNWTKKNLTGSRNILVGDSEADSPNQVESYITGYNNSATAKYAAVIGREGNEANASYCAILGAFDLVCVRDLPVLSLVENIT